jgi:flagellar assembly protein FliH
MVASAWALDELEIGDVFTPLFGEPMAATLAPADAPDATSRSHPLAAVIEAAVAERVAQLRPQIEEAAYARGHADGVKQAGDAGREQVTRVVQAVVVAAESIQAHEQRWLGNVEENLAATAVAIARHLLQRELTTDPGVITDLVARTLHQFPLEKQLTVRLHPDDHAVVREALADARLALPAALEILWQPDVHIVRGGCLVEGRERVLDGRIDTALERVYRALGQVQA